MDVYILFIKWVKANYDVSDTNKILLEGVYMSGPVLKYAAKVAPNDNIRLDFTAQYSSEISDYYIATLRWGDVRYAGGIIYLGDCVLDCKYKDVLPSINNDDYIVVDTSLHEEVTHPYFLNYTAELYSAFGEAYAFKRM
jgi:hypothetical protein